MESLHFQCLCLLLNTAKSPCTFPCGDGHETCRRAVIKNMTLGTLQWEKCITHRVSYIEAAEIYTRIANKDEDIVGVTINWTEA